MRRGRIEIGNPENETGAEAPGSLPPEGSVDFSILPVNLEYCCCVGIFPDFLAYNLDILSQRICTGASDSVDAYGDAYGRRQDDSSS
jgi:hypothetical protein